MANKKLYQKAYDAIRSKAQIMAGSQKIYRQLTTDAKEELRTIGRKILMSSDDDNPLKQYLDSKSDNNPGFVYLITNKAWPEWVKVGRTANPRVRLRNYQTSSPLRDYEVILKAESSNTLKTEAELLKVLKTHGKDCTCEWVKVPKSVAKRLFLQITKV